MKFYKSLILLFLLLVIFSQGLPVLAQTLFPIRILENPSLTFSTLQSAYNQAQSGQTIQCRAVTLNESVTLNRDIAVTICGGYNSDFSQKTDAVTVLIGGVALNSGTAILDNLSVSFTDTQTVPDTPTLVEVRYLDTKVYLNWSSVNNADGYIVKYSTTSGTYTYTEYIEAGTSHVVTNLTNNTQYYFVVSAYNASGVSDNSNELSAMPQPREAIAGYETVFSNVSTNGLFAAMPIIMSEDGTITSISMFHKAGTGSMVLGIYSGANSPQTLLATTQTTAIENTTGWQTITLLNPVHAENAETIWIAWLYSVNPGIRYTTGEPSAYACGDNWDSLGGTMPANFPASGDSTVIASLYINYVQNQPPHITELIPANTATQEETDTLTFEVTASDYHFDPIEYQFVIDDNIVQSWTSTNTYNWDTQESDFGKHSFKVQTRDDIGAQEESAVRELFIYHKPISIE
ncbi:MAG: fibronectin type III domain-containing protein [Candidatus Omnitrophota bacterium]